jgi:hypothetical protein
MRVRFSCQRPFQVLLDVTYEDDELWSMLVIVGHRIKVKRRWWRVNWVYVEPDESGYSVGVEPA